MTVVRKMLPSPERVDHGCVFINVCLPVYIILVIILPVREVFLTNVSWQTLRKYSIIISSYSVQL